MELSIIRHADPDYALDSLTAKGFIQADILAPTIIKYAPTHIYVSPMGRAQATAAPSLKMLGMSYEILPWTGEDMAYMQMPDFDSDIGEVRFDYKNGYTLETDFCSYDGRREKLDAMIKGSDELLKNHGLVREGGAYRMVKDTGDRVCVFCHGGFGSAWIAFLMGLSPLYGWHRFKLDTTSITRFVFNGKEGETVIPYCECLNNTAHKTI